MPPQTREEIDRRYTNDMDLASRWKETDPERYTALMNEANDRRYAGLNDLTADAERRANEAILQSARAEAQQKFPRAKAELIRGDTRDEILASAKTLHELIESERKAASDEVRTETRAARAAAFNRAGLPRGSGEPPPRSDAAKEESEEARGKINVMLAESGKRGSDRDDKKLMSTEDTLAAMRTTGKLGHLADIMSGSMKLGEGGALGEEDQRG
jgi:hypothetical protein